MTLLGVCKPAEEPDTQCRPSINTDKPTHQSHYLYMLRRSSMAAFSVTPSHSLFDVWAVDLLTCESVKTYVVLEIPWPVHYYFPVPALPTALEPRPQLLSAAISGGAQVSLQPHIQAATLLREEQYLPKIDGTDMPKRMDITMSAYKRCRIPN
ncbi:hypothetical protein A0H81_08602 [Grifola frondosa]|uniref:Uncharacterized protein n=1 Tax=Grifola frondosa TaxID=5627 RepID=A0A1C7M4Z8_GRIFR|nr:hypothetical protein A0H81_08602 [Grifola frondosa]